MHIVTQYNRLRAGLGGGMAPRTVVFSGKAAPAYATAKSIIKLIHCLGDVVNNDSAMGNLLKVIFIPNYRVSNAERIVPACDLSEQISTAGTEASGTGNMKLTLNGAITIGTFDGANCEIYAEVGDDNFFRFGLTVEAVAAVRTSGYDPRALYESQTELRQTLDMIADGYFSADAPALFRPLVDALLTHGDPFLLLADYASYIACQDRVDALCHDSDQ